MEAEVAEVTEAAAAAVAMVVDAAKGAVVTVVEEEAAAEGMVGHVTVGMGTVDPVTRGEAATRMATGGTDESCWGSSKMRVLLLFLIYEEV